MQTLPVFLIAEISELEPLSLHLEFSRKILIPLL